MSNIDVVRETLVTQDDTPEATSYVDWAAVICGALITTAIFVTLTTFGSAIGLSLTSPYAGHGGSAKAAAIAVAIWTVWVTISSFLAGGYIAGRMRHRCYDSTEHESKIRNGAHGLAAWAVATLLGGILISTALGGLAHTNSSNTPNALSGIDHSNYAADVLLRSDVKEPYDESQHHEVARILQTGAYTGQLSAEDHAYLTHLLTSRKGVADADAKHRVDAAVMDIRENADAARKIAILIGFLTAASIAIGAAAAWWAATLGGLHRDENIQISPLTRWR